MKFIILLLISSIVLSGCATLNFSSKYYELPPNYKDDIDKVWNNIIAKVPLKYTYSYRITQDKETKFAGIPQAEGTIISLPDYFIRYVYEFYYNDREAILTCIILHEMAHTEFNLLIFEPPEQHYLTDKAAIDNFLLFTPYTANHYYCSFKILGDYWQARKGVGGHLLAFTTNVALAYFTGITVDWFTTDINTRLNLIIRDYSPVYYVIVRTK